MKTGHHLPHQDPYHVHRQAITTGALRVFMKQLCTDMMRLHMFTGDTDMDGILQSCVTRLLQMEKTRRLELLVEEVLAHETGMPDIPDQQLLAEVLECYSDAARAHREGEESTWRTDTMIPDIIQQATPTGHASGDDAEAFVTSINQYNGQAFVPHTAFQQMVSRSINGMMQQETD
mgnify:CR=1 FL=1